MRRAALLLVLLVTVVAPRANATVPGTNGSLAYQSPGGSGTTTTDREIFVLSQFGGTTPVTDNDVQDFGPAWSPDGAKIAFSRRDGPNSTDEIYVMDSSGNNLVQLTKNSVDDDEPAWSPNGKRLVFTRQTSNGGELFVMDARDRNHDGRGDNLDRLTKHRGRRSFGNPAWSPNGKWIAFTRFVGPGDVDIYKMRPAPLSSSNRPKRLTKDAPSAFIDGEPDWSPDSNQIVFGTNRFNHFDIAVMNSDGTGIAAVTNDSTSDGTPVWSPDGTRIAFYRDVSGGADIFTVDPGGTNLNNETNTTLNETDPSWQPLP